MNSAEQAYLGDDALAGMLKKAGVRVDLSQIRRLLAGVLAAPEGEHPQDWIDLVAPAADSSCRAQLDALRRRLAAEAPAAPLKTSAERLAALRKELARRGLAGFLIPRADEHQGEYVPPRAERLAWLTGFTGSAGARHRAGGEGRRLRRRPLYPAGPRPGGCGAVRAPASDRAAAGELDRRQSAQGRQARLRPLAPYARGGEAPAPGRRQGGGRAGCGGDQPPGRRLVGSAAAAAGPGRCPRICAMPGAAPRTSARASAATLPARASPPPC